MPFDNFTIKANDYMASAEVQVEEGCVEWIAINQGGTAARVNGVYLKPFPPGHPELTGAAFSATCNERQYFAGYLNVIFETGGTAPWVQIVQRFTTKALR